MRPVRLPSVTRFAALSLLCAIGLALVMGFTLSSLLTRAVSEWEWEYTATMVRQEARRLRLDRFFTATADVRAREPWGSEIRGVFESVPEVVRVKAWDRQATVLWSDEPQLVGRRFPDNDELQKALAGRVAVEVTTVHKAENVYEGRGSAVLAEVYVPIFGPDGREVLGVIEVYKLPLRLFATIRRGQLFIWTISLVGGLVLWVVMLPLVRQVYGRDVREATLRAQAARLEATVAERTEELERQSAQLVQALKMDAIGRLAGGLAHDFNNLLTIIIGRGELLQRRLPADARSRADLDIIVESADQAASLTRQLLAFSRKQVLEPRVVDLNEIAARIGKMLGPLIGERIVLETALDPDAGRVRADAGQFEHVLVNLALNARDAMPSGGHLTIATAPVASADAAAHCLARCHPDAGSGDWVKLSVSDTGVGMDAATRSRVFEPFFTTKEIGKGTGLGLSTVYGIVTQTGGHICVHSEPGRGATFVIYLARVAASAKPAPRTDARALEAGGTGTVLLVEDEGGVRDFAREVLELHGYTVLEANNGAEALELERRHSGLIDLVLTDLVMPEVNGSDLANELKRRRPAIAAIYMSGYSEQTIREQGASPGGVPLLQKPFGQDLLLQRVREVLTQP